MYSHGELHSWTGAAANLEELHGQPGPGPSARAADADEVEHPGFLIRDAAKVALQQRFHFGRDQFHLLARQRSLGLRPLPCNLQRFRFLDAKVASSQVF